jgi:hypothetical protein
MKVSELIEYLKTLPEDFNVMIDGITTEHLETGFIAVEEEFREVTFIAE